MKKPVPHIAEVFPFSIRAHVCVIPWPEIEKNLEKVSQVGPNVIFRRQEQSQIVATADEPKGDQYARSFLAPLDFEKKNTAELGRIAQEALGLLAQRARNGDGNATWFFSSVAVEAAMGLSQMVRAKPKSFRPIARHYYQWPLMRSTHPLNSDSDVLLRAIELSKGPLRFDKSSKWKPGHAALIAIDLVNHIESIRQQDVTDGKRKFSDFLPPFSTATVNQWWTLAKRFLLTSYPHPEAVPEIAQIVNARSKKRRSSGRFKQEILDTIKARFNAIAKELT
jgi:hypothetical protein